MQQVYQVGAAGVGSPVSLPGLEPFRREVGVDLELTFGAVGAAPAAAVETFDAVGRVGVAECPVRCRSTAESDLLEVGGIGAFAIRSDAIRAEVADDVAPAQLEAALLGPALALALARRGVFVLHAAAVSLGGGSAEPAAVVGLVGDSGAGKSTLAQLLDREGVPRVADDQLAIALLSAAGPIILPHFPQLKLAPADLRAIARLPSRLPLRSLWSLAPAPPASSVVAREVGPAAATALVVRHTVAAALFSPALLAAHLELAGALAERVPIGVLDVPRRLDVAPEVHAILRARGAA